MKKNIFILGSVFIVVFVVLFGILNVPQTSKNGGDLSLQNLTDKATSNEMEENKAQTREEERKETEYFLKNLGVEDFNKKESTSLLSNKKEQEKAETVNEGNINISEKDSNLCGGSFWEECEPGFEFSCSQSGEGNCKIDPNSHYINSQNIDLRSVVAITCDFQNKKNEEITYRGSGVFISPEGYILTNRHLVDPEWAATASGGRNINPEFNQFKGCRVRYLHLNRSIKSGDSAPYNYYDLDEAGGGGIQYDFKAEITHLPYEKPLSEAENKLLDYAVLKVTEKNPDKYFSDEKIDIHYSPILLADLHQWKIIKDSRVVISGYPYQEEGEGSFKTFRLLTKDGKVTEIYIGSGEFLNVVSLVKTQMSHDSAGGRSGSPMFYKGYVVGIYQQEVISESYSKYEEGYQTTISAIVDNLKEKGIAIEDLFKEVHYFEIKE